MSLLIKGMEMPKHSGKREIPELYSIVLKVYPDGQVEASKKGSYDKHKVVSVPTPHGDLIDRRSIEDSYGVAVNLPASAAVAFIVAEIGQTERIIEAEEE